MAVLITQTNYNNSAGFKNSDNESINQSLYFPRNFVLDTVVLRCKSISIDPINDVKFRMELRNAQGDNHLLDLTSSILDSSAWINDENITAEDVITFTFNSLSFALGWYWLSLVSNRRVNLGDAAFSLQLGGSNYNKFIKIENDTGIYRNDKFLYLVANGSFSGIVSPWDVYEFNEFIITTIRDET